MAERLAALTEWLSNDIGLKDFRLEPASGDASFRRYFRGTDSKGESWIAMDAPPEQEDCRPFVDIARQLASLGLHVPAVLAEDLARGFLLLEDLGSSHYLDVLDDASVDRLYGDALGALAVIQACGPREGIPAYDRQMLMREMELFREWLLCNHLGIRPSAAENQMLDETFGLLVESALEQPRVCVLRDYHSRNLMVTTSPNPGILDFQDAVLGPVAYDLVSLLKDCYISWPRQRVERWVAGYFELAVQSGILPEQHEQQFLRWFDLMGVQRHLKAAGIFARLKVRDGKPGYLGDSPQTLGYVVEAGRFYPQLSGLTQLIEKQVLPRL